MNLGPQVSPVGPEELPNRAPGHVDPAVPPELGANASRRHEISNPHGRVYRGR